VLLIDTSTDLRQQALRFGVHRVDAVVYTHAHADHTFGIDELRVYNFRQGAAIPCYANAETTRRLRSSFSYIFEDGQSGGGKPKLEMHEIDERPFRVLGMEILPIPVWHGEMQVLGFRVSSFAYVTDCNRIPEESLARLRGVEILILDALRYTSHPTHFSFAEALVAAQRIGARQTYFTHMNHDVDYNAPAIQLPTGVELAYDGLSFEF
jgi:phosphoribosyl 1,2-cyclic phosphate phosphodiesterase